MPQRNARVLMLFAVLSAVCAMNVSRAGRVLVYAMKQIQSRYVREVDQQTLFEGAMAGMTSRLDDYSAYISPQALAEFEEAIDRQFGGIGIEIRLDRESKLLTVASPLVGTPAYQAGLRAGDTILEIDGQSTQGFSLADASERIRGKPGSTVALTAIHRGEKKPFQVDVVRAVIRVDTVLGDTRTGDGRWNYFLEGHDKIGYVRINSFSDQTGSELKQVVDGLLKQGMRGLILDLRDNPGGLLSAAIDVCNLFVDPARTVQPPGIEAGVIVTTRGRGGRIRKAYHATSNGTFHGFPVAVLVNGESASAAEIVAACLQDHGIAVVVGQRSFGKGTVQEILDLHPHEGILKVTTASYWRPSGKDINRREDSQDWGVSPNKGYEVKLDDEEYAKLVVARRYRDVSQSYDETASGDNGDSHNANDESGKNKSNKPQSDTDQHSQRTPPPEWKDRQLDKAVEYIEGALAGKS